MIFKRKAWLALGLVASSTATAGPVDERVDASAAGSVEVVNRAGKVVVTGWSESAVSVTGTLGERTLGLDLERHGDRVMVAVRYPEDESGRQLESDLFVSVPVGSTLIVRSVSADVEVSELLGDQRVQTVSGHIRTGAHGADLELGSVSGDLVITGQGEEGVVNVSTVSGDFDGTDLGGDIDASSVSGDIDLTAVQLNRGRLKTTSGHIDVTATVIPDGRLVLESMSGDVDLVLRDDEHVTVEAETFSGRIRNCSDETVSGGGPIPGQSLRFSRGDADRTVRMTSFSGDLDLCDL